LERADNISRTDLNAFVNQNFSASKASFLEKHGSWWYGGDRNRWVIMVGDQIAAYCAVIPAQVWLNSQSESALWWVDLVVAAQYRGQGLQSIFDREILQRSEIKLGFPNELAARIHRKHGWGVREDLSVLMLPLEPLRLKQVREAQGARRLLYFILGLVLSAWAGWYQFRALRMGTTRTREIDSPSAELLAGVFARYKQAGTCTTRRDEDFFRQRYLDSPYRDQYRYFIYGQATAPSHYAITRQVQDAAGKILRILDIFGDFQDRSATRELLRYVGSQAVKQQAAAVTALCSLPELAESLRAAGFIIKSKARFCWFSERKEIKTALAGRSHWTLGDSDNDEPL
jgi:hypothetical protein